MGDGSGIHAADLLCGAGGTTTGLVQACLEAQVPLDLAAVNHWPRAIQTHFANYPRVRHFCRDLKSVDPREAVPTGHLDILAASPVCKEHSPARGARPVTAQRRTDPYEILRWHRALDVDSFMIENVPAFMKWGPRDADGHRIADRAGEYFQEFVGRLRDLGYEVDYRILNSADYGAATIRKRLFVLGRKDGRPVTWPEPTHAPALWRPARDIIDWSLRGKSIFGRRRPLAQATLRRIAIGLRKFCREELKPFLVMLYGTNDARTLDLPTPVITAEGQHIALAQPFLIPFFGERPSQTPRTHSLFDPLPTVTSHGAGGLVEPILVPAASPGVVSAPWTEEDSRTWSLIVKYYGEGIAKPVSEPLDTITTRDRFGLLTPVRDGMRLDILFRMLEPHELLRAMSFPEGYLLSGSREDQIQQIGNAVEVRTARAIFLEMLGWKGLVPRAGARDAA